MKNIISHVITRQHLDSWNKACSFTVGSKGIVDREWAACVSSEITDFVQKPLFEDDMIKHYAFPSTFSASKFHVNRTYLLYIPNTAHTYPLVVPSSPGQC